MLLRIFYSYRGGEDNPFPEIVSQVQKKIDSSFRGIRRQRKFIISHYNYSHPFIEEDRNTRDDLNACEIANVFVIISSMDYFIDNKNTNPIDYYNTTKEYEIFRGNEIPAIVDNVEKIFRGNNITYKVKLFVCTDKHNKEEEIKYIKLKNYTGKCYSKQCEYPQKKEHKENPKYIEIGTAPIDDKHPLVNGISYQLNDICRALYDKIHELPKFHTYIKCPPLEDAYTDSFRRYGLNKLIERKDYETKKDVIYCPRFLHFKNFMPLKNDTEKENRFNEYCDYVQKLYLPKAKRALYIIPLFSSFETDDLENFIKDRNGLESMVIYFGNNSDKNGAYIHDYVESLKSENPNEPISFHYYSELEILENGRKLDDNEYEAVNKIYKLINVWS